MVPAGELKNEVPVAVLPPDPAEDPEEIAD